MIRVLGISGSLRAGSYNTALLRYAATAATDISLEVVDLVRDLPPYDEDVEQIGAPAAVAHMRATLAGADGLLFSTPEYNSSIPGGLKNLLDWASRPFGASVLSGLPVAVLGASTGQFGAAWSQAELRKVLGACGCRVIRDGASLGRAAEGFDDAGMPLDGDVRAAIDAVLGDLAREVHERRERQALAAR